jgi:hypothetical protein
LAAAGVHCREALWVVPLAVSFEVVAGLVGEYEGVPPVSIVVERW